MGRFELETRDYEILRTLARLHFLTSAEINQAFFSSEFAGYRRLRKLGGLNLIRRHTKGVPPRTNYCAWRLTGAGVEAVLRAYPEEPILEGLDDRLARQSLADLEHREAVSKLYLDVLRGADGVRPEGTSCEAVRKWVARVRARAERFYWRTDGSVVIDFRDLGRRRRIVPDGIASTAEVRLFIELDRSNKSLKRIEENILEYLAFFGAPYRQQCPDGIPPHLVYVVLSRARKANIEKIMQQVVLGRCSWKVLVIGPEATSFIASTLVGDEARPSAEPAAKEATLLREARDFLGSTSALLKYERRAFEELETRTPALMSAWKRSLRALHDRVLAETQHGR